MISPASPSPAAQPARFALAFAVLSAAVVLTALSSCAPEPSKSQLELLSRFENSGYEDQKLSSDRIEELKADILQYSSVVEQKVQAAGNLASALKLLGAEYSRLGMYRLAAQAYESALEILPTNPEILYQLGIVASQWAASAPDSSEKTGWTLRARQVLERGAELAPFDTRILYSLAVLLHFQFEENDKAYQLVERLERAGSRDSRTLFLKARLLAARGQIDQAASVYGEIVRISSDAREKEQALQNQRALLGSQ